MCTKCNYKYGSTKHLLYWAKYFFLKKDLDKFIRTWYHIINRKAYREWMNEHYKQQHFLLGYKLCQTPFTTDVPNEYVDYISSLDATDTLNEYYEL